VAASAIDSTLQARNGRIAQCYSSTRSIGCGENGGAVVAGVLAAGHTHIYRRNALPGAGQVIRLGRLRDRDGLAGRGLVGEEIEVRGGVGRFRGGRRSGAGNRGDRGRIQATKTPRSIDSPVSVLTGLNSHTSAPASQWDDPQILVPIQKASKGFSILS
jgi:hypothetical protein